MEWLAVSFGNEKSKSTKDAEIVKSTIEHEIQSSRRSSSYRISRESWPRSLLGSWNK
jgi:hypothetical protein